MKTNPIRVLKVEPHKILEPVMLKNNLDSLQKAVSTRRRKSGTHRDHTLGKQRLPALQ